MNELTPLHKKFYKILLEEWGSHNSCLKPQGCDFHKLESALQESMAVYIGLRHNGNGMRAHDYNLNRNTWRWIIERTWLSGPMFKDKSTMSERLGV